MDLCNFPDFSNEISGKGDGPMMTPLCVHLDPNYSTVTWTADGTYTETHMHTGGVAMATDS